jgi:hypothetical protein
MEKISRLERAVNKFVIHFSPLLAIIQKQDNVIRLISGDLLILPAHHTAGTKV